MSRESLELFVTDTGQATVYKVVASSPTAGQAVAVSVIDPAAPPLAGLDALPERPTRAAGLRAIGIHFFEKLFAGEVRTLFDRVLGRVAGRSAAGLDLILRIDPPELVALPWELLFSPDLQLFLGTAPGISLSRSLTLVEPVRSLACPDRLRILMVRPVSSGLDVGVEDEVLAQIGSALGDFAAIESLEGMATAEALRKALRQEPHVVHFAGHGAFRGDEAVISLDDREGLPRLIPAPVFAQLFLGRPSVRLVVLNACEGAARSAHRALAGIAPWLLRRGVPAVVAMQWPVRNSDAGLFATELYRELTSQGKGDLGEALARARGALLQEKPHSPAFANPVLYLRAAGGRLIGEAEAPAARAPAPVAPREPAPFLVPFPRNPGFVGRGLELAELHRQVVRGELPVGIRPTGVVGLGGIGKTQLAVEYAHAHREDHPGGVFWINASGSLVQAFADLAALLGLAEPSHGQEPAVFTAWQHLASRPDALVIFDNIPDPSELCRPMLAGLVPANLGCRILFTTRRRDFPLDLEPFELATLPEDAALGLLLRARAEILRESHPEWGTARIICRLLGGLPLALELAAAYLAAFPEIALADYLQRLRSEGRLRTVDDPELAETGLKTRHGEAIEATLRTQWTALRDRRARLLLWAAAQFPEAEMVPIARLSLLTALADEAPPGHPAPIRQALRVLRTISLIEELTRERLRLHPLVQEFAVRRTPPGLPRRLAERLTRALGDLPRLEDQVAARGVYAVLDDARAGLRLAGARIPQRLDHLEHLLDRGAHVLAGWEREPRPAALAQQILLRAKDFGLDDLALQAERRLTTLEKPFLEVSWRCGPRTPALLRTLGGSGGLFAGAVAIPGDGRRIVSGYEDGSLRIWDLWTGQLLRSVSAHEERINAIRPVPGTGTFLTASNDHTLRLWDLETGQLLRTLTGHQKPVFGAFVLSCGKRLLSAGEDKTLRLWDLQTGKLLRTLEGSEPMDFPVVLQGGRTALATGGRRLWAWDLESGEDREPPDLAGRHADILAAGGRFLVIGSLDHLEVHDLESGRIIEAALPERWKIFGIALVPGRPQAILGLWERRIEIWDLQEGRRVAFWPGHEHFVRDVAVSPEGRFVVSGSNDGTVKVWDLEKGLETSDRGVHNGPVEGLAWVPGRDRIVSGSLDRTIRVWQAENGRAVSTLGESAEGVSRLLLTPGGTLLSGGYGGDLQLWDLERGALLETLGRHGSMVWGIALAPDGRRFVSCADDAIRWWDLETREALGSFPRNPGVGNSVVISGAGALVLPLGTAVFLLDPVGAETLGSFQPRTGFSIVAMLLLPGSERLLLASGPEVQLWDLTECRQLCRLVGHREFVTVLAVAEDGRFAVSGSYDRELKVWDLERQAEVTALWLDANVRSLALTGTGHGMRIFAGDMIGNIYSFRLHLSRPV